MKKLTPRVPPFKVTKVIGTDTNRSDTYDFLLTVRIATMGPPLISYRLPYKRRFLSKIANLPHPGVFSASAEGVPLGI